MTELTLSTPSILFSAISLILLAYTNRFLSYAQVVRNLKADHDKNPSAVTRLQLANLRQRLYMARSMQLFGVSSLLLCVVCTFLIYIGMQMAAVYTFGAALILLVISLAISIRELLISVKALELHLDDLEKMKVLTRTRQDDAPSANRNRERAAAPSGNTRNRRSNNSTGSNSSAANKESKEADKSSATNRNSESAEGERSGSSRARSGRRRGGRGRNAEANTEKSASDGTTGRAEAAEGAATRAPRAPREENGSDNAVSRSESPSGAQE